MIWIRGGKGVYMAGVVVVFGRRVWNRLERHHLHPYPIPHIYRAPLCCLDIIDYYQSD